MNLTIKRDRNFEHIVEEEYEKEYDLTESYNTSLATGDLLDIVRELELLNSGELNSEEQKEIEQALNFEKGEYTFDCSDFTYRITVE